MHNEFKFLNMVSHQLRNFKKLSNDMYNFSCPLCGDSKTKKTKSRGYVYTKNSSVLYHCHNCAVTLTFKKFLQQVDPTLLKEYIFESYKNTNDTQGVKEFSNKMKAPKFLNFAPLKKLLKISKLDETDRVRQYVLDRKIPNKYHYKLFSCPKFKKFTNDIIPKKFSDSDLKYDETRLLIPFINSRGEVHAFQGRAIGESKLKYITIILDENEPKIYGLDTVNFNKDVFVFEGPIDSMFVENSIATAGGDIVSTIGKFDKENLIIVYDNEPRSVETKNKLNKAINLGYKVCIWPESIVFKDVNDMIMGGMKSEEITRCILENSCKDLTAKLKLSKWSKI